MKNEIIQRVVNYKDKDYVKIYVIDESDKQYYIKKVSRNRYEPSKISNFKELTSIEEEKQLKKQLSSYRLMKL